MKTLSAFLKILALFLGCALVLALGLWGYYAGWFGPRVKVLQGLSNLPRPAIVGLDLRWGKNPISDKIGDFYVDDPAVLKVISGAWISGGPAPYFLCGYNYNLNLVSDGEVKDDFDINLEKGCNTIVDRRGNPHWFDPSLIGMFEGSFKKPRVEEKTFKSLADARRYLVSIRKDPKFLMNVDPEWRRFDGKFLASYSCNATAAEGASGKDCLNSIRRRIGEKYPSGEFTVEERESRYRGHRLTELTFEVACTGQFHNKFDLFKVEKDSWKPLAPRLKAVFRK